MCVKLPLCPNKSQNIKSWLSKKQLTFLHCKEDGKTANLSTTFKKKIYIYIYYIKKIVFLTLLFKEGKLFIRERMV